LIAAMAPVDDLLDYIFDDRNPALRRDFDDWARASRRFRAFATTYRDKIRSKLRSARDEPSLEDLRAELETAALLLRDERFALEYERYAASKQRGPDFTVTFRTHTPFNVEVRRVRGVELDDGDPEARLGRLTSVLREKVGQMPPSIVNILWLTAERSIPEAEVARAATTLRQLAERKAEEYFTRRGFKDAADFLKQFRQLSGVVLRQPDEPALWLNSIARHRVPPEIVTAIQHLDIAGRSASG
jgi:hypothetical protein